MRVFSLDGARTIKIMCGCADLQMCRWLYSGGTDYFRYMNPGVLQAAERMLTECCGKQIHSTGHTMIGGGSINHAFRISTTAGAFFLKYNDKKKYPGMFEAEAKGLSMLRQSKSIRIPDVIGVGESDNHTFIILEFLERGRTREKFWEDFGMQLADMHRRTQEYYGADHDNYIGSLPQNNSAKDDFVTFFIENRIEPQLKIAGSTMAHLASSFEQLYKKLREIIPNEKPALIHGDLWSGNFLIGPQGEPCLIDPAVYYGHREADLAMSKLFGGFDAEFYSVYHYAFPLAPGWKDRVDVFNLYPLLVHVNLFGGTYVQQVAAIVRRFS